MITLEDLAANFTEPVGLAAGIYACQDSTPRSTHFYYLRSAATDAEADILLVSENLRDDAYAEHVLSSVPRQPRSTELRVLPLAEGSYPFTHVLLAPAEYHSHFKGILDAKRGALTLALPIHRCEFSGTETVDEFTGMRRHTVPTRDWRRSVTPKITLRFDTPSTKGGTEASGVVVKYQVLAQEIANLNGVSSGFIECANWEGRLVEILSPEPDEYVLIWDSNDATRERCDLDTLLQRVRGFLIA